MNVATRSVWVCLVLVLASVLGACVPCVCGLGLVTVKKVRLGTYNSRAVALAYGRSAEFGKWSADIHARHKRATDAGDTELANQIRAEAKGQQERLHAQVFGDAPIDDILKRIGDELPPIAAAAGVESIVAAGDYDGPPAEFVDVTDAMVALFNPTPETLKHIAGLRKTKPVRTTHDH